VGGVNARRGARYVFVPTGSAAFDFYGANRLGDNLFANCLLALDAATGKRLWHFQFVRHDVWDRDLPAPQHWSASAAMGEAWMQSRRLRSQDMCGSSTGQPASRSFHTRKIDVPPSDVDGEQLARSSFATQSGSVRAAAAHRGNADEDARRRHMRKYSNASRSSAAGRNSRRQLRWDIVFPGFDGGGDGRRSLGSGNRSVLRHANEMAWVLRLIPRRAGGSGAETGATL
jgi:quinoprotein glucose dehydrogenase